MKRFKWLLTALLVLSVSTTALAAGETEVKVVLDQTALMELDSNTRNMVLKTIQEQELAKAALENAATVEKTMDMIAGVNVNEFKDKAIAIGDAINIFCEKIGVTVNDFITTPAGNVIIFGALYKLGVFGSIWGFFKGFGCVFVLLWLLYNVNTRKKVILSEKNGKGEIMSTHEVLIPKLSAVFSGNKDEQTCFSVIASIIIMIFLFLVTCFVI